MSLAITAPALFAGREALSAASDLVEAQTAVNTIFEEGAQQIQTFAQVAAVNLGLSRTAALNAAVAFAGMGQAANLTGAELADFSEQLLTNAADLASFFNQDPGEMMDRLRSGLAGEAEPLRRYGILISEARVQTKALELGLADASGAISDQAKILARYAIIQEDMGKAMGDRARTADQFAGSLRTLQASTGDLAAEMGETLIPAAGAGVKALTAFARVLNDMPDPMRNAAVAAVALAAVIGPLVLVAGQMAIAVTALRAATLAASPALAALGIALAPIALALAGGAVAGVGIGLLARHIVGTGEAAETATPPIVALEEAIRDLDRTAGNAADRALGEGIVQGFTDIKQAVADARAEVASAEADLAKFDQEHPFTMGMTDEDIANNLAEQQKIIDRIVASKRILALTNKQIADAEADVNRIIESGSPHRTALLAEIQDIHREFLDPASGTTPEEWASRIDEAGRIAEESAARAASTEGQVDKATTAWNRYADAILRTQGVISFPNQEETDRWLTQATVIDGARRALEAYASIQAGLDAGGVISFPNQADSQTAERTRVFEEDRARDQQLADQRAANDKRRRDLERQTADEIKRINQDLNDTLKSLDAQREQNTRAMHRSLVVLERDTAQQIRQLEGQRTAAIAAANDQLGDLAEQRADNERALQAGLVDAQEAANDAFATIAESRIEVQRNAAEQMVEAERSATEALAALADRRKDIEEDTAESLADSRDQAAEALADLAGRQVDIQATLRDSLATAQEQYNDTLADVAEAQADVGENLGEQLSDLTRAWREQQRALDRSAKEIRADLRASLREMDAAWDEVNNKNLRAQTALRGEIRDTLEQNALTAQHLQDDLARLQADPTFTATEKEDAAFRTARALEGLALDRQLAERNAVRDIADLEAERIEQQEEYEAERATDVEQAKRDLADLNKRRMEGEKAYHERRMGLEEAAAEQIRGLNERRREAVEGLAEAEADAYKIANVAMRDLAGQRAEILQDQVERERDIRATAREQYQDLADDQIAIEQDLAAKQREIRQETADRMVDLAKQEADAAQALAERQQSLREDAAAREQDLADREEQIHSDLATRLAGIEDEKEIVARDAARERALILREHRNEAEAIAKEQGQAENDAVRAALEAQRDLRRTLNEENLLTARGQGEAIGQAHGEGEIAGLTSKQAAATVAGVALTQAVVTGASQGIDNLKIIGENLADALITALGEKTDELEEAGAEAAKAAEKGAKKSAEIESPSKVWAAMGRNMRQSLAAELAAGNETEMAARSAISRAHKAATDEFKRRRALQGQWFAPAEQDRSREERAMLMARDGRSAALRSQPLHVTLELDGRVLDERIIDTTVTGLRGALQRNPLRRRR